MATLGFMMLLCRAHLDEGTMKHRLNKASISPRRMVPHMPTVAFKLASSVRCAHLGMSSLRLSPPPLYTCVIPCLF